MLKNIIYKTKISSSMVIENMLKSVDCNNGQTDLWREGKTTMFEIKPKTFKKILVGVDDAPDARAAFSYAVDKAKRDGAELGIVSVYETNDVNVYQVLDKDYVHSSREELKQRIMNMLKPPLITESIQRRLPQLLMKATVRLNGFVITLFPNFTRIS